MSATQGSKNLVRELSFIDEAVCAKLESEILRREAAGEEVEPSQFRQEKPDPLGTDWVWAGAPGQTATSSDQPDSATTVGGHSRRFRKAGYALLAATAAGLLIALGSLLSGSLRNSGPESLALNVEPTTIQFFGTDEPQPTVTSPYPGFIAAVGITARGDVHIWPTEGERPGKPIAIRKGEAARIGPLPTSVQYIVVVVTEQPATLALMEEFGRDKIPADQWPGLQKRITAGLRGQNYRNLAIGDVQYPPLP